MIVRRLAIALLASAALVALTACETPPKNGGGEPVEFKYDDVASRYNRRVADITRLHARAVVEIDYVNADGKGKFEQGDGYFIFRRPLDVALSVGKLGDIFLWIGGDSERYWWFELKPGKDQPKTAYVGRHADRIGLDDGAGPLPVGPDELLGLIGLTPIPEAVESMPNPEVIDNGQRVWVTTPLGDIKGSGPRRLTLIDTVKARPVEVRLLDESGQVIVETKLGRYEPIELEGAPPGAYPWMPTRIELHAPSRKARLTLYLSNLSDGVRRNKIKDSQFDFEKLTELLEVDRVRVIRPRASITLPVPIDPAPPEPER